MSDDAPPACEQLWPKMQKLICKANRMVRHLLKELGVDDAKMSPFCVDFETTADLLKTYVAYCPRTFAFNGISGMTNADKPDDANVSGKGNDQTEGIAARLRSFAKGILTGNEDMEPEEALEYGIGTKLIFAELFFSDCLRSSSDPLCRIVHHRQYLEQQVACSR